MIVVADTSPMLHLGRIGRVALIHHVVGRVTAPRTVWEELTVSTSAQMTEAIAAADWIDVLDDPPLQDLGLDPGETAAILLAEVLSAEALLIDERQGRLVAQSRGSPVIGTLGIVAGARRRGLIAQAAPVLDALHADGFWLSDALVKDFLRGLGELT